MLREARSEVEVGRDRQFLSLAGGVRAVDVARRAHRRFARANGWALSLFRDPADRDSSGPAERGRGSQLPAGDHGDLSELREEITRFVDQGYTLLDITAQSSFDGHGDPAKVYYTWVAERPRGAPPATGFPAGAPRYEIISGLPGAELQQRLDQVVAAGYRLRFGVPVRMYNGYHITLILELIDEPAPPVHYLVAGTASDFLEIQMETLGRRGYRPHPAGFFGNPRVVIMERDVDEYQAYEFAWVYGGDFDAQLMEYSVARYEFLASGTTCWPRVGDNGAWYLTGDSLMGIAVRASDTTVFARGTRAPTVPERCTINVRVRDNEKEMNEQLNGAAQGGFCLVNVGAFHDGRDYGGGLSMTLEQRELPGECEYFAVSAMRQGSVQKDFNSAGKEGFRLVPNAVFARLRLFNAKELAAIMERTPETTGKTFEYLVLGTNRESTMLEEIDEGRAEGYEVVVRFRQGSGHVTYMERVREASR